MPMHVRSIHRLLVPLLSAMVTVAGCDDPSRTTAPPRLDASRSAGAAATRVAAPGERPFTAKLTWRTYAYVTAAQSGDSLFGGRCSVKSRYVESGTLVGEMTHGGLTRGTGSHCVQRSPSSGITYTDGTLTLTSANGDLLFVSYDNGRITAAPGGVLVFRSEMTVTGGTGRFESATGWAEQLGTATGLPIDILNGAPIEMELTGGISYAPGRAGP